MLAAAPPTIDPSDPVPVVELKRQLQFAHLKIQLLEERLRLQRGTAALRARAEKLAGVGWTERALAVAISDRVWTGAHGGAVITWLADLASQGPLHPTTADHDSRTTTLRLRAEAARTKSAAAGPDSPARNQARELVAQLGRRNQ